MTQNDLAMNGHILNLTEVCGTAMGLVASFIGVKCRDLPELMPAYTDHAPVGGRPGGGYLVDPSSGCGGDNCAVLPAIMRR